MENLLLILAILILLHGSCYAENESGTNQICSSSCGDIHNIRSPFRLTTDPLSCGDLRYNLSCESNILVLYLKLDSSYAEDQRYYVKAINYNNYTIRVVDPNIRKDDCSSFPNNTLFFEDLYLRRDYAGKILLGFTYNESEGGYRIRKYGENVILFNCESRVLNSSYIDATPCLFNVNFSSTKRYYSYYYVLGSESYLKFSELEESCSIQQVTVIDNGENIDRKNASGEDIRKELVYGFQLSWIQSFDKTKKRICYLDEDSNRVHCVYSCLIKRKRLDLSACGKD